MTTPNMSDPNLSIPDPSTNSPVPGAGGTTSPSGLNDHRYPSDPKYPEWAWGKTPDEVVAMTQQLEKVVQGMVSGEPQQSTNGAQQPIQAPPAMDPDAYIQGRDVPQLVQNYAEQYVAPYMKSAMDMAASNSLEQVKREYAKEFGKFGPQILSNIAQVDKRHWTLDNLRKVVKYSLIDHVDELARDRAAQLAAEQGLVRPTGASSPTISSGHVPELTLASEKIPAEWRKRAEEAGLTERALDEFLASQGETRERWFKGFERGNVVITEKKQRTQQG